jgi:hypothetical protein
MVSARGFNALPLAPQTPPAARHSRLQVRIANMKSECFS